MRTEGAYFRKAGFTDLAGVLARAVPAHMRTNTHEEEKTYLQKIPCGRSKSIELIRKSLDYPDNTYFNHKLLVNYLFKRESYIHQVID